MLVAVRVRVNEPLDYQTLELSTYNNNNYNNNNYNNNNTFVQRWSAIAFLSYLVLSCRVLSVTISLCVCMYVSGWERLVVHSAVLLPLWFCCTKERWRSRPCRSFCRQLFRRRRRLSKVSDKCAFNAILHVLSVLWCCWLDISHISPLIQLFTSFLQPVSPACSRGKNRLWKSCFLLCCSTNLESYTCCCQRLTIT